MYNRYYNVLILFSIQSTLSIPSTMCIIFTYVILT